MSIDGIYDTFHVGNAITLRKYTMQNTTAELAMKVADFVVPVRIARLASAKD
jgi:hypothetical protein